ncbi:DUF1620-domain-containing protein [Boletus edulis BED1]|uniref:ER membrane protein complex subunit 1 n=1 Tax=Boletus edulis BED1 TaxID=1328754 RepID=A0AAD4GEQ4_BOLED|nr:DUF1620-domain-containing protein [Boletus edulis BED1]
MQLLWCLLSLFIFTFTVRAIHESEVGIVDWHTKLVGVPMYASHLTKPVFHEDTVFTATSNNVLAALNATDGSIVWRSIHDAQDAIMGFKVHDDSLYALSGPAGSTLRIYDVSTGHLIHEKRLHNPMEGKIHEPPTLGLALTLVRAEGGDQSIVLTNGHTVQCIHSSTGEIAWEWRSEDQSSLVMYTHIYPDTQTSTLYVAGFAKSVRSYTLHVSTLNLTTGGVIASVNIPASIANTLTDFLLLGPSRVGSSSTTSIPSDANADAFGPSLVWLSPSSTASNAPLSLFSAPLSPPLKGKVLTIPNTPYKHIQDVGLSDNGLFMAFRDNGTAEVLGYETGGSPVGVVWDFGDVTPSASTSGSHFVGALNGDGNPCIGKIVWSNLHNQVIHQTFEANLQQGTGQVTGFTFPFETNEHGTIRHVAFSPSSHLSPTNETPHKLLLVTSTGSLQLWDRNVLQWVREESLATVQTVTIVELPPTREEVIGAGVGGKSESFWSKIARQIGDTKNLPHYIIHFVTRFVTGSYATPSSPISLARSGPSTSTLPHLFPNRSPASPETLVRDPFSFRQLLIASTAHGKLFALDTSTGAIVWSRILGLGWARKVGGRIAPAKAFMVRKTETGGGNGVPEGQEGIALITQRIADNTLVDTVIFHFDPLTGEDIKTVTSTDGVTENPRVNVKDACGRWVSPLEGVDAIAGPLIDVFLLPDGKDTIGMLDEFLQVQLYPDTPITRASLTSLAPQLYFALRAGTQVLGHQLGLNDELSFFHVAFPTWGVSFGEDEEVVAIIKSANKGREVASIGRVKGDRSTLYKYLNPHLSVVISAPRTSSPRSGTCGLYVVDTVKGTVLYHVSLPVVNGKCDIQAVLDENWLVYSYYDDDAEAGGAKGYRIVSVEMYEGNGPDEKTSSSDITSYSGKTTEFSVYEQVFAVPHGVTAIATTTTKFGVSTKDIIISSRKNAVHSIPRRLLNPRRPKRKPTSEEAEEMLVQYDPALPDDGRLVLSHYYDVADVRQIITASSLLESTSLVLAVGTDLFLTRVATSGTFDVLSENFNKMQLVLTVVGLAVAIAVTKPMVRRRKLREQWYQ